MTWQGPTKELPFASKEARCETRRVPNVACWIAAGPVRSYSASALAASAHKGFVRFTLISSGRGSISLVAQG